MNGYPEDVSYPAYRAAAERWAARKELPSEWIVQTESEYRDQMNTIASESPESPIARRWLAYRIRETQAAGLKLTLTSEEIR